MSRLAIAIIVTLALTFAYGCKEQTPPTEPVAKEEPKAAEPVKSEAEMVKEEAHKVRDHVAEESQKAMDHAMTEAHKTHAEMEAAATVDAEVLARGEAVYTKSCAACHTSGVAGAPKLGDQTAWSAHIEHGVDHMIENVINGKGTMPARGGNPDLSDEEIMAAVQYMVEKSK